jgi:predicted small secreted protein/cytochrome c556
MKRSVLVSSLVLALATALAACGGGSGSGGETPAGGGDTPAAGGDTSNDDPVAALQKISDDIQKDVDAIITPVTGAGDVISGVISLKTDIKVSATNKFDWKKFQVELVKVTNGQDADIASLKLDADSTAKITDRVGKLKDLIAATKNMDQAVKDLGQKITDALPKVLALGPKALAKAEVTLKNPFASAGDKAAAQANKDKITGIMDGFKVKATKWQADLTALPAKAKDIPNQLAKLKP